MKEQMIKSEESEEIPPRKKRDAGFVILMTQSVAAIGIVLLGLLLRWIGGDTAEQIRTQLESVFTDNAIVDAVVTWWTESDKAESQPTIPSQQMTEDDLSAVSLVGRE